MKPGRTSIASCLVLFLSLAVRAAESELVISEVMADNRSFLQDVDKEYKDWIEIYNGSTRDIDLGTYFLSDSEKQPDKWQLPAMTLPSRRFLLVFCSGKDRRDPAAELHANFRLRREGGAILLSAGDLSVVSSYFYPEQVPNASYGPHMDVESLKLLGAGALARILVPTDATTATGWTAPEFDDAAWKEGTTALGFGVRTDEIGMDLTEDYQGKNSSIYIRIPFEVGDPTVVDSMALRMLYDDGFIAWLNGQEVARKNTPTTVRWDSKASRVHEPNAFEEIDISTFLSGLRPGRNVLAIQGLFRGTTDTDFFVLPEVEVSRVTSISPEKIRYFPEPTPRRPNRPGLVEKTPRPSFSHESRAFADPQDIEITTGLEGAEIRYTLDGTRPTAASTLYEGPIHVTGTTRIVARVFKEGSLPGISETKVYMLLSAAVKDFRTNLPLIICSTMSKSVSPTCSGGPYTPGVMLVIQPNDEGFAALTDEATFAGSVAFRRRGSSTCGNAKPALNVQLWDEENLERSARVLDFPEDSDFILHGSTNYDRSLLHNPFAYWLSREVGQWAARTKFVECYFQQGAVTPFAASTYYGIYAWMEKNKRHPEKVDIEELSLTDNKEPRIGGGYLLRRDRVGADEVAISGGGYGSLVMVYPKHPSPAQSAWITNYLNKAAASLSPNIATQDDNAWIDVTSWRDTHIVNWYTKNVDAYRLSGYFFKSRSGLWAQGPVWDFDRSMGGADDDRARFPEGWDNDWNVPDGGTRYFQTGGMGGWCGTLFQNAPPTTNTPWNLAYKARWRELRRGPMSTSNISGQIDAWAEELREAGPRDTKRWPSQAPRFGSLQGEINFMKNWLVTRADWIDAQFLPVPIFTPTGGLVPEGTQVTIAIDSGATIYYTLDGTDPKDAAGQPTASAIAYTGPIEIGSNVRITARGRDTDGTWSTSAKGTFLTEIPKLMITEFMYSPPPPTTAEDPEGLYTASKMEFVEIQNVGTKTLPLAGVRFTRGVIFDFTKGTIDHLDPGEYAVLVVSEEAFAARYGSEGIPIAGQYSGLLSDRGAKLTFLGSFDEVILEFTYSSTWHPDTAGAGRSLVNADPAAGTTDLGTAARWKPSVRLLGSPGREDPQGGFQMPGDANGDGRVSLSDAIALILFLGSGTLNLPCEAGLGKTSVVDWNGDQIIDLSDAISALHFLFLAGTPHTLGQDCEVIEGCGDSCPD